MCRSLLRKSVFSWSKSVCFGFSSVYFFLETRRPTSCLHLYVQVICLLRKSNQVIRLFGAMRAINLIIFYMYTQTTKIWIRFDPTALCTICSHEISAVMQPRPRKYTTCRMKWYALCVETVFEKVTFHLLTEKRHSFISLSTFLLSDCWCACKRVVCRCPMCF